jgi:chemotaxis protein histidine kinase CheA
MTDCLNLVITSMILIVISMILLTLSMDKNNQYYYCLSQVWWMPIVLSGVMATSLLIATATDTSSRKVITGGLGPAALVSAIGSGVVKRLFPDKEESTEGGADYDPSIPVALKMRGNRGQDGVDEKAFNELPDAYIERIYYQMTTNKDYKEIIPFVTETLLDAKLTADMNRRMNILDLQREELDFPAVPTRSLGEVQELDFPAVPTRSLGEVPVLIKNGGGDPQLTIDDMRKIILHAANQLMKDYPDDDPGEVSGGNRNPLQANIYENDNDSRRAIYQITINGVTNMIKITLASENSKKGIELNGYDIENEIYKELSDSESIHIKNNMVSYINSGYTRKPAKTKYMIIKLNDQHKIRIHPSSWIYSTKHAKSRTIPQERQGYIRWLVTKYDRGYRSYDSALGDANVSDDLIRVLFKRIMWTVYAANKFHNFTHADLHGGNVLVNTSTGNIKLFDFDFSSINISTNSTSKHKGKIIQSNKQNGLAIKSCSLLDKDVGYLYDFIRLFLYTNAYKLNLNISTDNNYVAIKTNLLRYSRMTPKVGMAYGAQFCEWIAACQVPPDRKNIKKSKYIRDTIVMALFENNMNVRKNINNNNKEFIINKDNNFNNNLAYAANQKKERITKHKLINPKLINLNNQYRYEKHIDMRFNKDIPVLASEFPIWKPNDIIDSNDPANLQKLNDQVNANMPKKLAKTIAVGDKNVLREQQLRARKLYELERKRKYDEEIKQGSKNRLMLEQMQRQQKEKARKEREDKARKEIENRKKLELMQIQQKELDRKAEELAREEQKIRARALARVPAQINDPTDVWRAENDKYNKMAQKSICPNMSVRGGDEDDSFNIFEIENYPYSRIKRGSGDKYKYKRIPNGGGGDCGLYSIIATGVGVKHGRTGLTPDEVKERVSALRLYAAKFLNLKKNRREINIIDEGWGYVNEQIKDQTGPPIKNYDEWFKAMQNSNYWMGHWMLTSLQELFKFTTILVNSTDGSILCDSLSGFESHMSRPDQPDYLEDYNDLDKLKNSKNVFIIIFYSALVHYEAVSVNNKVSFQGFKDAYNNNETMFKSFIKRCKFMTPKEKRRQLREEANKRPARFRQKQDDDDPDTAAAIKQVEDFKAIQNSIKQEAEAQERKKRLAEAQERKKRLAEAQAKVRDPGAADAIKQVEEFTQAQHKADLAKAIQNSIKQKEKEQAKMRADADAQAKKVEDIIANASKQNELLKSGAKQYLDKWTPDRVKHHMAYYKNCKSVLVFCHHFHITVSGDIMRGHWTNEWMTDQLKDRKIWPPVVWTVDIKDHHRLEIPSPMHIVDDAFTRNFANTWTGTFDAVILPDCGGIWTNEDKESGEYRVNILYLLCQMVVPGGFLLVSKFVMRDEDYVANILTKLLKGRGVVTVGESKDTGVLKYLRVDIATKTEARKKLLAEAREEFAAGLSKEDLAAYRARLAKEAKPTDDWKSENERYNKMAQIAICPNMSVP